MVTSSDEIRQTYYVQLLLLFCTKLVLKQVIQNINIGISMGLGFAYTFRRSNGRKDPVTFRNILIKAVETLNIMLRQYRYMSREAWAKAWGEALCEFNSACIELATGLEPRYNHSHEDRSL